MNQSLKNSHLTEWVFSYQDYENLRLKRLAIFDRIIKEARQLSVLSPQDPIQFTSADEAILLFRYSRQLVRLADQVFKSGLV